MESTVYTAVFEAMTQYMDRDKASLALERQLKRCGKTPSNVTADDFRTIRPFLAGSITLNVPRKPDQERLNSEIDKIL